MAATYSVDGQSFGSIGEVEDYLSGQGYDSYTIDDRRQGGAGRQSGVGMGEGAGLLGAAGGGGGGGLFGGPAPTTGLFAPGAMFGASASPAAAATGKTFMGYGYTDPKTGQWVSPGMDMRDGGGKGRSGDTFQGGIFSGLLNTLGVRPAGYRQRLEDNLAPQTSLRPQMRPAGLLGGTAGTQRAVDRAVNAASAGDTSAAQNYGVTLPVSGPVPVQTSLLPSTDPFMQMLQRAVAGSYNTAAPGVPVQDYAPLGASSLLTQSDSLLTQSDVNYLAAQLGVPASQYEARAGDRPTRQEMEILDQRLADTAQSRMVKAERARYARAGAPFVVPLPALRRAAGTPNASLAAVGPDAALYSYLSKERARPTLIRAMQQPEYAGYRQKFMDRFQRDNMLPASALEAFR